MLDPQVIFDNIDIDNTAEVADFGCGPGYLAIPLATHSTGIIHCFDVLPQVLDTVNAKARAEGLKNVVTERVNLCAPSGSHLEDISVSLVIMRNVLWQNEEKEVLLSEAHRILEEDGQLLLIGWSKGDLPIGPPEKARITQEQMITLVQDNSFTITKKFMVSDYHYAVVAQKK